MPAAENQLLTPRDLAQAIGTSESSVRRWLDAGSVKMTRTAGGHRRIALAEAMRFIRETGATVVRPEILGVRGVRRRLATPREAEGADALFEALAGGRGDVARGLLATWYLGGRAIAEIFDGPVRMAMERIGELWQHDTAGILQEHRATAACVEAIGNLRDMVPAPAASAPVALGGAPEGDYYLIPTLMAGTILREAGFRVLNYGANSPLGLLADAANEHRARIVWVSVSSTLQSPLTPQLKKLRSRLKKINAELVIGGRMAQADGPLPTDVRLMGSMGELAAFAAQARR